MDPSFKPRYISALCIPFGRWFSHGRATENQSVSRLTARPRLVLRVTKLEVSPMRSMSSIVLWIPCFCLPGFRHNTPRCLSAHILVGTTAASPLCWKLWKRRLFLWAVSLPFVHQWSSRTRLKTRRGSNRRAGRWRHELQKNKLDNSVICTTLSLVATTVVPTPYEATNVCRTGLTNCRKMFLDSSWPKAF